MSEKEQLVRWCQGHTQAVQMLETVFEISQLADDIADKDCQPEMVTTLGLLFFGDLMRNPFWQQNALALSPVVCSAWSGWALSLALEKAPAEDSQMMAWAWRELGELVLGQVAHIIGGPLWAQQVALEAHKFYHLGQQAESFASWQQELRGKEKGHG